MARNKRDIELQVKRDELDQLAARLFLKTGYEATSMARIAQALNVAPNNTTAARGSCWRGGCWRIPIASSRAGIFFSGLRAVRWQGVIGV